MSRIHLRRKVRKGFTLIELLTAILIVETLMAVALPLYLATITDAEIKACHTNMQTVANIESAYKSAFNPHTFTTDLAALGRLEKIPHCPVGGVCSIVVSDGTETNSHGTIVPAGWLIIKCNAFGHGDFVPGME